MPTQRDQPHDQVMSFGDHLDELRHRLMLALVFPIPLAIVLFFFSNTLIQWLLLPVFRALRANGLPQKVTNLTPVEMTVTQLKLSLIFALIFSAPWVLWQAWKFIGPGLYSHEQRFVRLLIPGSFVLTVVGAVLLYFVMLPLLLSVLIAASRGAEFQGSLELDPRITANMPTSIEIVLVAPASPQTGQAWVVWPEMDKPFAAVPRDGGGVDVLPIPYPTGGTVSQEYRVSETINFILLLFMGVAIAFQMPLVVLLLGWMGLATTAWLRERRKYALFICGIASAVLTPTGDMISMMILLIPLYALYELGILLLVIAPASRVSEGKLLRWPLRNPGPDNSEKAAHKAAEDLQTERTVPHQPSRPRLPGPNADGGEDRH